MSSFIEALEREPNTFTENGAGAHLSTNNSLLDLFGQLNSYEYDYEELSQTLDLCWEEDKVKTLRLIAYGGAITRTSYNNSTEVKGAGLKDFRVKALRWLYLNHRDVFLSNLLGWVETTSWSLFWHKEFVDCWVKNKDSVLANFIASCLVSDHLARKYLPRYKTKSNINRAQKEENRLYKHRRNRGLELVARYLGMTMPELMKLKSEGTAHKWQQQISEQNYEGINFDNLPGKVLTWITKTDDKGQSFLSRHGLESKFIDWLDSKDNLKTTSYLHELANPLINEYGQVKPISKVEKFTINKQVQTLLDKSTSSPLNVMPLLDTSGSMATKVANSSALCICLALGVYFSMTNTGDFKNTVMMFDTYCRSLKLRGSFVDRIKQIMKSETAWGNTNFQSAVDKLIEIKESNPNISDDSFPDVMLVISDMAFDSCGSNSTNHTTAVKKLKNAGVKVPVFLWWYVRSTGSFEVKADNNGVILYSGFDPAGVDMILSGDFMQELESQGKTIQDITPQEAMNKILDQDWLHLFTV